MTDRENWLRCIEFRNPEWIPVIVAIQPATWWQWGEKLRQVTRKYPRLVATPDKDPDPNALPPPYRLGESIDEWGCKWRNVREGLEGIVVENPLDDWAKWRDYKLPDPLASEGFPRDWDAYVRSVQEAKRRGQLASASPGLLFERLIYLRGFENLMIDFMEGPPQLGELIDALTEWLFIRTRKLVEAGVDLMSFGDDMGLQDRPMISPETFRKWLRPAYEKLWRYCRENGVHVFMHSDGYTIPLIEQFIEMGCSVVNPQDLVNGLDNIARVAKGKVCICLDIDRQSIVPFGTPEQIDQHIRRCVEALWLPEGGLSMIIGIYPDVPPENVDAVLNAFSKYCLDLSWLRH